MSRSPTVAFGMFRRGALIASGGMGEVFVASRLGPGGFEKPVALKLLLPDLCEDPEAVRMFLEEGRLSARMSHPNIVQVFEIGQERERYYLAMELVAGVSLAALIRALQQSNEQLSGEELVYLAHGIAEALQHAHEQRGADGELLELVHRDVSPHNILISHDGHVKLSDFGIARVRSVESRTRQGSVRGKLQYLAPEQLRGEPIDRRVDLYALGVTLYQAAALVPPLQRDNDGAVVAAILNEEPIPLAILRPELPASLVAVITRALAKKPAERFQTAAELLAELPPVVAQAKGVLAERVRRHGAQHLSRLQSDTSSLELGGTSTSTADVPRSRLGLRAVAAGVGLTALLAGVAVLAVQPPGTGAAPAQPTDATPAVAAPVAAPSSPAPVPAPPAGPPVEPAIVAPAAEPAPSAGRPPAPVAKATTPRKVGYLSFDAVPWAQVFVEGQRVGETPIAKYPVDRPIVWVTMRNPETGKSKSQRVQVPEGGRKTVRADLR